MSRTLVKQNCIKHEKNSIHNYLNETNGLFYGFILRWLLLGKNLKGIQANGQKYLALEKVREEAEKIWEIEKESDFSTVVDFFHDRHVALHYTDTPDLAKLVLLDAQWLIDIFKEVITIKPWQCQEKEFEKHWQALEREGVLHLELVQHVWKDLIPEKETIACLLLILEKFDLACRWTRPDGSEVCDLQSQYCFIFLTAG